MVKTSCVVLILLGIATVRAQSTTDVARGATAVKVIDNRGTIKYFQSNNGITQIVNTTSDVTTTTWQLGGELTDATNITTGANELKITLNDGTNQGTFVIDGIEQETGIAADGTTIGTSGWTLLARDEATGQIKNLLASDLVSGIRVEHTQATDATGDVGITVTGLPTLDAFTTAAKLYVYRNGAKLRFGTDFNVAADLVTITYDASDLPMYLGDVVEIQYIK